MNSFGLSNSTVTPDTPVMSSDFCEMLSSVLFSVETKEHSPAPSACVRVCVHVCPQHCSVFSVPQLSLGQLFSICWMLLSTGLAVPCQHFWDGSRTSRKVELEPRVLFPDHKEPMGHSIIQLKLPVQKYSVGGNQAFPYRGLMDITMHPAMMYSPSGPYFLIHYLLQSSCLILEYRTHPSIHPSICLCLIFA
ncbi:uncharacterized protein LOC122421199 [Cervus canadensis]|uniref:uncharacterized protein LOC122421199 n=1 Tax=Cervus canadensis TaxID=1574408 RepID=UPI001CA3631D|nr:uncharacterized protein LOC122421199 [Cervus canadensis]